VTPQPRFQLVWTSQSVNTPVSKIFTNGFDLATQVQFLADGGHILPGDTITITVKPGREPLQGSGYTTAQLLGGE
jgi:archaellum component FlaF (FlaF/FlaG flagellin family)